MVKFCFLNEDGLHFTNCYSLTYFDDISLCHSNQKAKKSAISNNSKTMKDTVSLSADFLSKIVDITEK